MTLAVEVKNRIDAGVPDLAGKVEEAADFAALVAAGQLPQRSPWAFVLKLGSNGGAADITAGLFRQPVEEVIGVVLFVQSIGDVKARRALASIDALEQSLIDAICGWAPVGAIGAFALRRSRLIAVNADGVFAQVEFALQNQLRIT